MKVDVLLGLQWGDEGKGKVVDVLTPKYDVVTRFQGGPNAGHTLEFEGQKYVLRSIPSGIFQGGKKNIIGNGVVLDPVLFRQEAESLAASGHDLTKQLCISKKAHLILPTHRVLDAAYEAAKGDAKIGTTGKGIGPTYTDKVSRDGLALISAMAIFLFSISRPNCFFSSSATSLVVTEPNSLPPCPALAVSLRVLPVSSPAAAWALFFSMSSRYLAASSRFFRSFIAWASASTAKPRGKRKFRAYPSDTFTSSPFFPCPLTSCFNITFMSSNLLSDDSIK